MGCLDSVFLPKACALARIVPECRTLFRASRMALRMSDGLDRYNFALSSYWAKKHSVRGAMSRVLSLVYDLVVQVEFPLDRSCHDSWTSGIEGSPSRQRSRKC